ncbi:MAG: aminopeptidase P N-terminal domain-containing protein, partial [Bacteroidota bacterium]
MNKILISCLLLFCLGISQEIFAQKASHPDDFLSSEFHQERREAVRERLPKNSVAVFFSNPVRNRANDVDYIFHQDPNFYYLTGHREPHSMLLIFSEEQSDGNGDYDEII